MRTRFKSLTDVRRRQHAQNGEKGELFAIRFKFYGGDFIFEWNAGKERVAGELFQREVRFGPAG